MRSHSIKAHKKRKVFVEMKLYVSFFVNLKGKSPRKVDVLEPMWMASKA